MGKIPVDGLISQFETMFKEHWSYKWGYAQRYCVDCSGALVYGYRQYGQSIEHGSNAIARLYVVELVPISEAKPGMAAFKIRKPGDKWYDLPAKYQKGGARYNGDLNDYYHVGLVDHTGKSVLNAQSESAGFTRTPVSKWACVGYLKAVDYDREVTPMETYIVTADNGLPVRVRDNPNGNTLARLKVGTEVQAGEPDSAGWQEVRFDGKTGYMMAKFLKKKGAATPTDLKPGFSRTLTQDEYNALCEARDILIKIVGVG